MRETQKRISPSGEIRLCGVGGSYWPRDSAVALAESDTVAGALHARDAVRNFVHAASCAVFQAFVALFIDVLNVVHAAFTAVRTPVVEVCVYACCNAVARAA